mmetsp:Transcript_37750/g.103729  ORF Transcript_37750/g.103729 Transcript_37750/m.103729 type:complete len:311 (-) Transcript_37750:154-1086(-)
MDAPDAGDAMARCNSQVATASQCPWPVSWAQLPGRSNEDAVCLNVNHSATLFAVFDGHGGRAVADLAARRAPGHLWAQRTWPAEPCEALRGALRDCHEEAREAGLAGGSTAVLVAVAQGRVSVCNAGDARVVAGLRGGGARRLSVDHKASEEAEAARVRSAGGFVIKGRLCAMIAVTRGLGDFDFEDMGMTCEPHLDSLPQEEVEFLVLASDGLWDIVNDEQCCSLVRSWGRKDTVAHRLATHARKGGTDDDVTVIVVWLDGTPRSQNGAVSDLAEAKPEVSVAAAELAPAPQEVAAPLGVSSNDQAGGG